MKLRSKITFGGMIWLPSAAVAAALNINLSRSAFLQAILGCPDFLAARAALYLPSWVSHSWFIIRGNRRGNARASGQITSNFLTQESWRLYEIRQPPTCLCTTYNCLIQPPTHLSITSNFLTNTTIETFHACHLGTNLATTSGGRTGKTCSTFDV